MSSGGRSEGLEGWWLGQICACAATRKVGSGTEGFSGRREMDLGFSMRSRLVGIEGCLRWVSGLEKSKRRSHICLRKKLDKP